MNYYAQTTSIAFVRCRLLPIVLLTSFSQKQTNHFEHSHDPALQQLLLSELRQGTFSLRIRHELDNAGTTLSRSDLNGNLIASERYVACVSALLIIFRG